MAIINWKIEREKGFSQVTLEIEGEPIISLENYLKLVKALIFEVNRDDVSVVLLAGPPEKFFFGMDIREIGALKTTIATRGSSAAGQDMLNQLEASPASLICAVDGTCFGGGLELAMVFHIIFATPSSSFGLPEIRVGTIPSFGGTQRLPRIVGRNRALRVMLTGETFSAQTAKEWGLVTEVIPREDLIPTVQKLGRRLAALSRHAVKALLRAAIKGLDAPLMGGLALESFNSSQLAGGQDLEEGIKAFFEKRSPLFPSTLEG